MLSHEAARKYYDWFGAKQDAQAFYEDAALEALKLHADFAHATRVFEFGCGTGRLARDLLEHHLPPASRFVGVDSSRTMIQLATARLAPFGERARVELTDGTPACPVPTGSVDRIVSAYVLDLLTDADIRTFLHDAARALPVDGRLCLVGLTFGARGASRVITAGWRLLFRLSPWIVGGCRPLRLASHLAGLPFGVMHHEVVSSFGIASEVLVAGRVAG